MLRGNEVTDLSFGARRWFPKWSAITPTDTHPGNRPAEPTSPGRTSSQTPRGLTPPPEMTRAKDFMLTSIDQLFDCKT
jgi:hypothetical protein